MDREKERREQMAFNASTSRRYKRGMLRSYMQAFINCYRFKGNPPMRSLAQLELISSHHQLRLMGFRRFRQLAIHAQNVRDGTATVKRPF